MTDHEQKLELFPALQIDEVDARLEHTDLSLLNSSSGSRSGPVLD